MGKWTPKSDKLERRRCQDERCPSRKIHEGIPPGSSEAGNGREAIIAGGSPPVVPGAIDVRVLRHKGPANWEMSARRTGP